MTTCWYCGRRKVVVNHAPCRECAAFPCWCGQNVPIGNMCLDCNKSLGIPFYPKKLIGTPYA